MRNGATERETEQHKYPAVGAPAYAGARGWPVHGDLKQAVSSVCSFRTQDINLTF